MSHNILIPFYHTFIAVIDNAKSQLAKLTECIWINNLSILLTIKLYTFIFFAVCGDGLEMVTTNEVSTCVCAADYYQTAAATDALPPQCTACPLGSTSPINSQQIAACGKNTRIFIPIDWY